MVHYYTTMSMHTHTQCLFCFVLYIFFHILLLCFTFPHSSHFYVVICHSKIYILSFNLFCCLFFCVLFFLTVTVIFFVVDSVQLFVQRKNLLIIIHLLLTFILYKSTHLTVRIHRLFLYIHTYKR